MKLLRWAATLAIESGLEQIDHAILAQAYEERLAEHFRTRRNPFLPPSDPPRPEIIRAPNPGRSGGTPKRVKPRKRQPSMSDVLSQR